MDDVMTDVYSVDTNPTFSTSQHLEIMSDITIISIFFSPLALYVAYALYIVIENEISNHK
jgi:hypothetical protein